MWRLVLVLVAISIVGCSEQWMMNHEREYWEATTVRITEEDAKRIAEEYVRDHKLNWMNIEMVVLSGTRYVVKYAKAESVEKRERDRNVVVNGVTGKLEAFPEF